MDSRRYPHEHLAGASLACVSINKIEIYFDASRLSLVSIVNMPRSAARQKVRFSIIEGNRQAVRLVLLDFPRILIFNGRRGHA